jgi:hypothetical protein
MTSRDASAANAMGWETSLARLAEKLTHADTSAS